MALYLLNMIWFKGLIAHVRRNLAKKDADYKPPSSNEEQVKNGPNYEAANLADDKTTSEE
jgi:hypothetical protein